MALFLGQIQAVPPSFDLGGKPSIMLQADRVGNYLFVNGLVNGQPVRLAVDSGAGLNVLTWEAAKRLGIEGGVETRANGAGTASQKAKIVTLSEFSVGGVTVKNDAAVVVDLPSQLQVDGLVGYSFLRHFATTFDYDNNQLIVHDPASFQPPKSATPSKMRIQSNHPHVTGTMDGVEGWFVLDTGNNGSATVYKWFAEQQQLDHKWKTGAARVAGKGVGGFVMGRRSEAPKFVLAQKTSAAGRLTLDLSGAGAFADKTVIANIGAEHLRRFRFTLDYPHKQAYFEPSMAYSDVFREDRSGIRADFVDGKQVVIDVQKNSPAGRAGIKVGDVLLAINGKPMSEQHPIAAVTAFQAAPGTNVKVQFQSKGETRELELTLEDLPLS